MTKILADGLIKKTSSMLGETALTTMHENKDGDSQGKQKTLSKVKPDKNIKKSL